MSFHSPTVLALVLCLGQTVNTQQGSPSQPSISAEPGLSILIGHPVTFTCSNVNGYKLCRLEKGGNTIKDLNIEPAMKKVIFRLHPVNESTAGQYSCICNNGSPNWSPRSETVELKVTKAPPDPGPASDLSWIKEDGIYILIAVSAAFLLCLALLLCLHRHRRKKQGLPDSKSQQQSPQKRLSQLTNGPEKTPGTVTEDRPPEEQRTETRIPVTGSLQEVTYAQLNHHALTQRTVQAGTPQNTDIVTESSTYASIIRH